MSIKLNSQTPGKLIPRVQPQCRLDPGLQPSGRPGNASREQSDPLQAGLLNRVWQREGVAGGLADVLRNSEDGWKPSVSCFWNHNPKS